MGMSWIFIALFLTSHFLVVYSHQNNEDCSSISQALEKNITSELYGLEVALKKMAFDGELPHEVEGFHEIPVIMHNYLLSNYKEAESSLNKLIQSLSSCAKTDPSVHVSKATLDFAINALVQAKSAHAALLQLMECEGKKTTMHEQQVNEVSFSDPKGSCSADDPKYQKSSSSGAKGSSCRLDGIKDPASFSESKAASDNCVVDGTKCQFSACAQGIKLPVCSFGFGAGVTGGAAGTFYTVNQTDDDPTNPTPGSLRYGVKIVGQNPGGVWIVFKGDMVINLKQKLWVNSDTTIDGRGANVTLVGNALSLATVENIILINFEVFSTGYSDTVHIYNNSRRVWVDHLTSRDAQLGLVSVVQGSTDVTISNCYLSNHNYNMLLGAADTDTIDKNMRVTVSRNWYESSRQRMPHCRWGFCHVVNNYHTDWSLYAVGGKVHAKIYSERNVYEPGKSLEVTNWFDPYTGDMTPIIVSDNDLLLKGATFHQFVTLGKLDPPKSTFSGYNVPTEPTSNIVQLVTQCSGILVGDKLTKCMATP